MDGLHFCLTDGSPIKNPSESKSLKKNDDDDLVISRRNKKKENRCLEKKKEMVNT